MNILKKAWAWVTGAKVKAKPLTAFEHAQELGFKGTPEEFVKSLAAAARPTAEVPQNRAERRAMEFSGDENAKRERIHENNRKDYLAFLKDVENIKLGAKSNKRSLLSFTTEILKLVELTLGRYIGQANQELAATRLPDYQMVLMYHACVAIKDYADAKSPQSIAIVLIKFVEDHFKLNGLMNVMYRHKATVHYNERCDGMTEAILYYFTTHITNGTIAAATLPFDNLRREQMMTWENFKKAFYQKAIDIKYAEAMQHDERARIAAENKKFDREHSKNKKHRARRVSQQTRRRT